LIEEIPENHIPEIIDFISFLKSKKDNEAFKDLLSASESSKARIDVGELSSSIFF